jgi:prevent-host-death family protein
MQMHVADDIVTAAQFKSRLAILLKQIRTTRRPIVITQRGVPAAVVLSPEEYDRLVDDHRFIAAVNEGLEDVAAGRVLPHAEVRRQLMQVIQSFESA